MKNIQEISAIAIGFMMLSSFAFMTFVHNIDNAWNLKTVEQYYNETWQDCTTNGICLDSTVIYNTGLTGIMITFFLSLMVSYILGIKLRRGI